MTSDQKEVVKQVFQKFLDTDNAETEWTDVDEQMSMLEWIDDHQITIEAAVKIIEHSQGTPRCHHNHSLDECFVPLIIDAVKAILELYEETQNLHEKNRFILSYYLALSHVGFIVTS